MGQKGFDEKRRYVRLDIRAKVNVSYKAKNTKKSETVSAFSKNLSVDGVCFTAVKRLKTGSVINLDIFLNSEKIPLRLKGKVMWSRLVKKLNNQKLFDTGVKLFTIVKGDENKFVEYVCLKMMHNFSKYLHL
ncbi:MAG: PilZ domain-containing protein [Candidatus Omnitrophota bacterium]|nr:PilZ domain-containing protein [Candidatus Omnitrophota bacterium]